MHVIEMLGFNCASVLSTLVINFKNSFSVKIQLALLVYNNFVDTIP